MNRTRAAAPRPGVGYDGGAMKWGPLLLTSAIACRIELNPDFIEADGDAGAGSTGDGATTVVTSLPGEGPEGSGDATAGGSADATSTSANTSATTDDTDPTDPDASADTADSGTPGEHRIFITSSYHAGNFGGIESADGVCQSLADAAALGGTFRAIVSQDGDAAADRLTITGPVRNMEDVVIAEDGPGLWDGMIADAITVDEQGMTDANGAVWTGTLADGSAAPDNCSNWTSDSPLGDGHKALKEQTNAGWIAHSLDNCNKSFHLYCIEQ